MGIYPSNPFGTYNPYYMQTPVNPVVPAYQPAAPQGPHMEIQRVNGKDSAYAFSMGPNSSVILVDNLEPKVWIVTTDSSGYKAVKGFKVVADEEEPQEQPLTVEDRLKAFTERLDKLEERMNGYGKPDNQSAGQVKSGNANVQSADRNGQDRKGSNGSGTANVGQ